MARPIRRSSEFDDCATAVFGNLPAADEALRAAEFTLALEPDLTIFPIVDVAGDVDIRALKMLGTTAIPACIVIFTVGDSGVTLQTVISADRGRTQ